MKKSCAWERDLLHELCTHLAAFARSSGTLWVAYSGGADSTLLLYLAKRVFVHTKAIYVYHDAAKERTFLEHCQGFCDEHTIPFIKAHAPLDPKELKHHGLECASRTARYACLKDHADPQDVVLLAHHANDQAETVLLNLLRKSGAKGLSAMPKTRALGEATLARPWLSFSRQTLRNLSKTLKLSHIEDAENASLYYRRSYVRHQILPTIEKKWPQVIKSLNDTAKKQQDIAAMLDDLATIDLTASGFDQNAIPLAHLVTLSRERQQNALRRALITLGIRPPSTIVIERIQKELLHPKNPHPTIAWNEGVCQYYQRSLYLYKAPNYPPEGLLDLPHPSLKAIPSSLGIDPKLSASLKAQFSPAIARTKFAKNVLRTHRIPPWERKLIPYIFHQNSLVAIGDIWLRKDASSSQGIVFKFADMCYDGGQ